MTKALHPLAVPLLAGLLVFAGVLVAPQVLNDGDTFWHLATGERMLATGQVIHADPFSHTMPGAPWQTHEWLSEVLMALAFRAGGWSGLVVLTGLAAGGAAAMIGAWLSRYLKPLSVGLALALALGCLAAGLLARPHLLTLPLLAGWTIALLRAREQDRAPPLWMAGLMTVWANMHGGYIFGLALIGPFALEALIAAPPGGRLKVVREWGVFGVLSLIAALVTPHGIEGLLFPFQVATMTSLPGIAEWRPTDFSHIGPLEIALLATLFVTLSRGVRIPELRLLVLLLLLHMAFQHVRHQSVLAVVAPLLLAWPLGAALNATPEPGARNRLWIAGAVGVMVILAAARLALPIERTDGPTAPVSALAAVPPALAAKPVLNGYGFGGYLISQGVKPFIDGRADMYGDAFMGRYLKIEAGDAAALDAALAKYEIAWTILPPRSPLIPLLEARGWEKLHADRYAVVQGRSTSVPSSATR